jgi:hypothetical protein
MQIVPVEQLHNWDDNPKTLSEDGFERLKKQIKLGQHSTLLVMSDGTVIGGNSRLRVMREYNIPTAKCIILDFMPTDDGFVPTLDGEVQKDPETGEVIKFNSIEDGKLAYALSHNDEVGVYSKDDMANIIPNHDLDWSMFGALTKENVSVADWVDNVAPGALEDLAGMDDELPSETLQVGEESKASEPETKQDPEYKERELCECPDCGNVFDPRKHPAKKGAVEGDIE